MQEIVVIDGEISLQNHMDGEWDLNIPADGDPEVIIVEGGGQTYPHYSGDYTVTPSTTAQVLETDGKVMDDNVTVNPIPSEYIVPTGTKTITQNGTHDVAQYESAVVDVQGGITPTGTKQISITTNGVTTEDVTNYADVEVTTAVPASAVDTGTKAISSNGTHDVVGYANASVNVPNSYSASDEGKVVSNGALVAQSSDTVTANDTYDTTLINSLTVNVSGGGGDIDALINGSITTVASTESTVRAGAFMDCSTLTSATLTNASPIEKYLFDGCTSLASISVPSATQIDAAYNFRGVPATSVIFPSLTSISGGNAFNGAHISTLVFPKLATTSTNAFNSTTYLTTVDFGSTYRQMGSGSFSSTANVNLLILRKADACVTLSNVNSMNATKFKNGGTGGTIYIPKALYDHLGDGTSLDYQNATNWSTVHGYGTITWAKIEGSIYENAYADGTVIA